MKTPQQSFPELAKALHIPEIYLKREDLHPYGSHKGRSIPLMVKEYVKNEAQTSFVISSSGNAALAAVLAVQKHNQNNPGAYLSLTVLVGERVDKEKLLLLKKTIIDPHIILEQTDRPKQHAFRFAQEKKALYLRQSIDDLALAGYHSLATELDRIPNLEAIFIPTSSGTTAQALGTAFLTLTQKPQIHIVQTASCHPMVNAFYERKGTKTTREENDALPSVASAIVDHVGKRRQQVTDTLINTNGNGWIATNEEIQSAIQLVKEKTAITISPSSALAIVGIQQATQNSKHWNGAVVALITGR